MQQPQITQRGTQSYVAIPIAVRMQDLGAAVDRGFAELFAWLAEHSLGPAGPPFIRYLQVDMDAELAVELAVPVDGAAPVDERYLTDPTDEPDASRWQTELAYLLADESPDR